MLRVGLDITPLVGPPTGIHQHTRGLAEALAARDDVELSGWLLSRRGEIPGFPGPTRRSPVPASIASRTWRFGPWPNRHQLAGDVDVVHGTNFLGPPDPSTVITIQDLTPLTRTDLVESAVAAKAPAIRRAIDRGAWVHVSSELIAAELVAQTGADRVRVVHHALPQSPQTTPGRGRQLAGHDRYVAVVGTTERRKCAERVVAAIADLEPTIGLVVVGPPGNAEPALDAAIERFGVRNRVTRLRNLDDADRASVVAEAAALALASNYEGFGFTPLEALRAGVPVAATAVGALPELIGDLVPLARPDGEDFVIHLQRAVDGTEVSVELRDRLDAMTWAQHAEKMMDLYALAARS